MSYQSEISVELISKSKNVENLSSYFYVPVPMNAKEPVHTNIHSVFWVINGIDEI